MKTREQIDTELHKLVESHYYSEDYELEWAAKKYYDALSAEEKDEMESVLVERLTGAPGMSDISLCARLGAISLTPYLSALLDKQAHSTSMSRALLAALSNQPDEEAFTSVERFIESEQEGDALVCLARMNFKRALPHLRWAIQQSHLHNFCVHAIHEFARHAGMEVAIHHLRELAAPNPDKLRPHLEKVLTSKKGDFNPFSEEELATLLAAVV